MDSNCVVTLGGDNNKHPEVNNEGTATETKDNNGSSNVVNGGGDYYREKAISLESAYKHYGKGRKKFPVLLGLDMNVEKGTIYGLLGNLERLKIGFYWCIGIIFSFDKK